MDGEERRDQIGRKGWGGWEGREVPDREEGMGRMGRKECIAYLIDLKTLPKYGLRRFHGNRLYIICAKFDTFRS